MESTPADIVENLPSDSFDSDYELPPRMPPRAHDTEASGLGSSSDPALLAILNRLTQSSERHGQDI